MSLHWPQLFECLKTASARAYTHQLRMLRRFGVIRASVLCARSEQHCLVPGVREVLQIPDRYILCGAITSGAPAFAMQIILYGISNCDTVKKARAWLDEYGIAYAFHDYKTIGIERERLQRWCAELGWENLLNRAGTTFRKLPGSDKTALNECKAIGLMLVQPSMIKRPVLDLGKTRVIGFKPEVYRQAMEKAR